MSGAALTGRLRIEFISDWQVGEGAGRPDLDRLVRRDPADRLPFVPAKTLRGIWRDGCELVATGLDEGSTGSPTWSEWVNELFGDQPALAREGKGWHSPRPAQLFVSPARFSEAVRSRLMEDPPLAEVLTQARPGVRIDRGTGQAMERHLRMEEVVRGDAVLHADFGVWLGAADHYLVDPNNPWEAAAALLWAGLTTVQRLGGGRRRGLGRCRIHMERLLVPSAGADGNMRCLAERWRDEPPFEALDSAPPDLPRRAAQSSVDEVTRDEQVIGGAAGTSETGPAMEAVADTGVAGQWVSVPLALDLLEPVVAGAATRGNVILTRDHVPGTALLGAISAAVRERTGLCLSGWLRRGEARVLNAYPELEKRRARPVPMALFREKTAQGLEGGIVFNRLYKVDGAPQLKQYRSGFVAEVSGGDESKRDSVLYASVVKRLTTHNTVDDEPQRPTEAIGGVYSFEALAGGIRLRTELRLSAAVAETLRNASPGWHEALRDLPLTIGRSRKDDYGGARLSLVEDEGFSDALQGQGIASANEQLPEELTIWLLSDLLLLAPDLTPVTGLPALAEVLGQELGCELHPVPGAAYLRPVRREGWHVLSGLPQCSQVGLAAGGCVRFKVSGEHSGKFWHRVQALETAGLGERTAEGFGEICINPALLGQKKITGIKGEVARAPAASTADVDTQLGDTDRQFQERLTEAAWLAWLRRAAVLWGFDPERRKALEWSGAKGSVPNSQLGLLRELVQRAGGEEGWKRLRDWLNSMSAEQTEAAGGELDTVARGTVAQDRWPGGALDKLRHITDDQKLACSWAWLKAAAEAAGDPPPATETTQKKSLGREAVRALLLAAVRAEQRQREAS